MWSSAFTSARVAVADAPPLLILAVRFAISGLLAIAIAYAVGQKIQLSRQESVAVVVLGICQNTVYLGMCFMAVQRVDASLVVIIASMLPLLVAIAHWLFFGERTRLPGVIGLLGGLAGVMLITSHRMAAGADPVGVILAGIGLLALTAATLLVGRTFSHQRNLLMLVGLQMLAGSLTLLPISMAFETWTVNWTTSLMVSFSYTVLVPGIGATLIWFMLVGQLGPIRAATFHFLNPFFGVLIAAIILAEPVSTRDILGVVVIMAGILTVQLSRQATAAT